MKLNGEQSVFITVLKRDLVLAWRHANELLNPLIFFLMVITLFSLALGPEQNLLQQAAPAIIWVAAILAAILSLDMLFRNDYIDGSLEQFLLSSHPLLTIISAKILAHWLLTGAPLIVTAICMGFFLYLPEVAYYPLLITLLLGTPVLSLLGAALAALTTGLRSGGMLLPLLILPLYIPVLIFAVAAVTNSTKGLSISGELYFLAAVLVLAVTLAPMATVYSLRIRLS